MSGQLGHKSKILIALMVIFTLWSTTAYAGVNEDFLEATNRGDLAAVKSFIANGADVNVKMNNGGTALILASLRGYKEVVQLLLTNGANVKVKMNNGGTALMGASEAGHKEVVQALLSIHGAEVNAKDSLGRTALMFASKNGHKEVVQFLLTHEAEINAKMDNGLTALMAASEDGHDEIVQLLVTNGANVNAKMNSGGTALMFASKNGHKEVVQFLLTNGADVNATMNNGATALLTASEDGRKEVVRLLLANGADVNVKMNNGGTVLMTASQNGRAEVVQLLLTNGADVNAKMNDGTTALMIASKNGHKEVVQLLTNRGGVDAKDNDGMTALMSENRKGHSNAVKIPNDDGAKGDAHSEKTIAAAEELTDQSLQVKNAGEMNTNTGPIKTVMDVRMMATGEPQVFFSDMIISTDKDGWATGTSRKMKKLAPDYGHRYLIVTVDLKPVTDVNIVTEYPVKMVTPSGQTLDAMIAKNEYDSEKGSLQQGWDSGVQNMSFSIFAKAGTLITQSWLFVVPTNDLAGSHVKVDDQTFDVNTYLKPTGANTYLKSAPEAKSATVKGTDVNEKKRKLPSCQEVIDSWTVGRKMQAPPGCGFSLDQNRPIPSCKGVSVLCEGITRPLF